MRVRLGRGIAAEINEDFVGRKAHQQPQKFVESEGVMK